MKVGLVGFARSGKTTIFNVLTGMSAEVGSFETKREAAIAVLKVPDPRVDALAEIVEPDRKKYAEVTFLDFPPSEERKAALDTRSLTQMREVEALTQVVAAFDDPMAATRAEPLRDLRGFQAELILADMGVIEKRLERVRKEKGKERDGNDDRHTLVGFLLQAELSAPGSEIAGGQVNFSINCLLGIVDKRCYVAAGNITLNADEALVILARYLPGSDNFFNRSQFMQRNPGAIRRLY